MLDHAGTGKSTYINKHLVQGLPKEGWTPIFITFSARTTSNMAQEQVCVPPPLDARPARMLQLCALRSAANPPITDMNPGIALGVLPLRCTHVRSASSQYRV